jgi:uncharacterized repeat protein (TIGR01451 family)
MFTLLLGLSLAGASLLLVAGPLARSALAQANCTVNATGGGSHPTIQSAIAAGAGVCDTITVSAGIFNENLTINRALTVQGAGKSATVINGNGNRVILILSGAVTLKDFRVTGGDATSAATAPRFGGGIYVTGGAILAGENLQIDNNVASTANSGAGGGGGIAVQNNSAAYLTRTMIISNIAQSAGNAAAKGGGLYLNQATLSLVESQIMNNQGISTGNNEGQGGGMFVNANSFITLRGNTWSGNLAQSSLSGDREGNGGAIAVDFPTGVTFLTISDETFTNNIANASNDNLSGVGQDDLTRGGGLFLNTTNTAGHITATLTNITMTNNVAKAGSGTGQGLGGAIYGQHSSIAINKARLFDNAGANSGSGEGGGIYVRESATLLSTGGLALINTILAGNRALGSGNGAALHLASHDLAILSYVTIADDNLNNKQAIYFTTGDTSDRLFLANTIVASHTIGVENTANPLNIPANNVLFYKNTNDGGFSEYLDGGGIISSAANRDPRFVSPAAKDYHIRAGSAAIDTGAATVPPVLVDIDDNLRPQGNGFDIGADEGAAKLEIVKSGPTASANPISYTLTITNNGALTATNLLITDTLPAGATYHSGGTLTGNQVQWQVAELAPNDTWQDSFRVNAGQTPITNNDYGVSADNNVRATGTVPVTTQVYLLYLPLQFKE